MAISAWTYISRLESPNGELVAEVLDLGEVAMSGPTIGDLHVSNGIYREGCGPSIVWSHDSRYLAVPEWTRKRDQRLVILSMEDHEARYAPGIYGVLQLESFEGGVVVGVDSPIYKPRRIEVAVEDVW